MKRRCLDCSTLIDRGSRCTRCQLPRQQAETRLKNQRRGGWSWTRTRQRIIERDMGMCQLCGRKGEEVDHIVPLSRGGTNADYNLRLLCHECHVRKGREDQLGERRRA